MLADLILVNFLKNRQSPILIPRQKIVLYNISFRKMFVLSRTRDFRLFYFCSCVDITNLTTWPLLAVTPTLNFRSK